MGGGTLQFEGDNNEIPFFVSVNEGGGTLQFEGDNNSNFKEFPDVVGGGTLQFEGNNNGKSRSVHSGRVEEHYKLKKNNL
jgi:hypothetical protein